MHLNDEEVLFVKELAFLAISVVTASLKTDLDIETLNSMNDLNNASD